MLVRHNGVIGWCGNCFREYVAQLMKYDKKFVIIGNKNAITYKEFFPLLKDNKAWIGYSTPSEFGTPEGTTKKINGLCRWFTNLDIKKRHEKLILWKNYTPEEFPKYDNYDAINVDKVSNIPCDYCESWMVTEDEFKAFPEGEWEVTRTEEKEGEKRLFIIPAAGTEFRKLLHKHAAGYREKIEKEISKNMQKNIFIDNSKTGDLQDRYHRGVLGVPITFFNCFSPEQFRIVGNEYSLALDKGRGYVHGKRMYSRIFIQKIL